MISLSSVPIARDVMYTSPYETSAEPGVSVTLPHITRSFGGDWEEFVTVIGRRGVGDGGVPEAARRYTHILNRTSAVGSAVTSATVFAATHRIRLGIALSSKH